MKKICLGISLFVLLMSCSIEKRHYRSGFYVEHKQKQEEEQAPRNVPADAAPLLKVKQDAVAPGKEKEETVSVDPVHPGKTSFLPAVPNKKYTTVTDRSHTKAGNEVKKSQAKQFLKTGDDGPRVNISFREILLVYLLGFVFGMLSICILFTIGLDAAAGSLGMIFVVITSIIASVFMLVALLATLLLITLFVIRKIKAYNKAKETRSAN